jgi:drug/metabolite transporter (DMT)-like permease
VFTTQVLPAIALGLAAALAAATSNAMQHRVAGSVPASVDKPIAVLGVLLRKPVWLLATGISFSGLLLHGSALRLGSIALVQPIILVGVVLAIPMRAALELKTPTWKEVRAVLVTMTGLGAFLACVDPSPSSSHVSVVPGVVMVLGGLAAAAWVVLGKPDRRGSPRTQAAVLAVVAGVMFGLTAGLLKAVGGSVTSGSALTMAAPLAALVATGLLGTAMNQRAYQLAPLSTSMPLVNVVDVVVAVAFGALVFHEAPTHTPGLLVVQGAALVCLAFGLHLIARLGSSTDSAQPALANERCSR